VWVSVVGAWPLVWEIKVRILPESKKKNVMYGCTDRDGLYLSLQSHKLCFAAVFAAFCNFAERKAETLFIIERERSCDATADF